MLIWLPIVIPIIACIYLLGWHRQATKWWELAIVFVIPIACIITAKVLAETMQTRDTEYWGYNTIRAEHYEPYSYWTTCTRVYVCGSDSKGNPTYCTQVYPCVQHVPRKCYLVDQFGSSRYISHDRYKELAKRWKDDTFVELQQRYIPMKIASRPLVLCTTFPK
jgi:hypothetical protein